MSIENVNDLVVRGKAKLVPAAVQEALDEGCDPNALLDTMIAAMDVVGENFKNGNIFVLRRHRRDGQGHHRHRRRRPP